MLNGAVIETLYKNLYKPKTQLQKCNANKSKNAGKDNIGTEDIIKEHTILLSDKKAIYHTDTNRVGWRARLDYAFLGFENPPVPELAPLRTYVTDPNRLLECVITTILLLAKKQEVPATNFMCTEIYLRNIRDEFGDSPKNIEAFVKYLNRQKNLGEGIQYQKYKQDIPPNLTVTKITNPSKIPRLIRRSVDQAEKSNTQTS